MFSRLTMSNLRNLSESSIAPPHESKLQRVRQLGHLLDNAFVIPGTKYRIGLDPLIGLLPGGGDLAGVALSAYIVFEAARFGVPKSSVGRMVVNLIADALLGTLPVLGDLLDFSWKANSMNLALLESHITAGTLQRKADRKFMLFLVIVLLAIVAFVGTLITLIAAALWKLLMGG
jgi:Domain of unknown function (DUF4112)